MRLLELVNDYRITRVVDWNTSSLISRKISLFADTVYKGVQVNFLRPELSVKN